MAKKKNWVLIIVGVVVFVVIICVVAVVGFGYYMYRQMEITKSTDAGSLATFEQVSSKFEGQQPYIEMSDPEHGEGVVHHELEKPERTALTKLRVVAYDSDKKELVQLSVPFWLLRLGGRNPIRLNQSDLGVRLSVTAEDIERRGRGLILNTRGRHGERVIIWAE